MSKRKIGTIVMALGLLFVLSVLAFFPEQQSLTSIGFAAIGFGCMFGITERKAPPPKVNTGSAKRRRKK